uniref:RGS domain-containing protein n=1 Tax=Helobdella robusta TaxID=6412 RepID=T1EJS2_HELRO
MQLKLSTVLTDPDLLFPFMQFMKAEASVNVLQFYLIIEEFNQKVLTPELTEEKLNELHVELCKLYDNYFNPTAHDCIRFDEDVVLQIKNICEGPAESVKQLQTTTPLFRAYEHAYDLLEHNFLPLFHQSD